MRNGEVVYGVFPAEKLTIHERELQRRLGLFGRSEQKTCHPERSEGSSSQLPASGFQDSSACRPQNDKSRSADANDNLAPVLEKCRRDLLKAAECRTAWVKVPVDLPEDGICLVGDMKIQSRDLSKNLKGCREAVLMGVTLGIGVDRLLQRLSRVSLAEHFITDGLASALVESLCDALDRKIRTELGEGFRCRPRYSPGYGDCSIEVQRPLLQMLQAGTTLGITLNDSYLMTPVKSITAIMGIEE